MAFLFAQFAEFDVFWDHVAALFCLNAHQSENLSGIIVAKRRRSALYQFLPTQLLMILVMISLPSQSIHLRFIFDQSVI